MNKCIYRSINECKKCNRKKKEGNYCNYHKNNENYIYEIIEDVLKDNIIFNQNSIYKIYKYIYENNEIYTKELIFKTVLNTLYNNNNKLLKIYNKYNIKKIEEIYNINKNTYEIEITKKQYNIIKRFIYKCIIKKIKINEKTDNDEDPFTFDLIKEIPENKLFKYRIDNRIYGFNALELKYFINISGNWNPYTKEIINNDILKKLDNFIKYNNLNIKDIEYKYKYNTEIQAYTKVSQLIEKIGFYNDVKWFLKLDYKKIKLIIKSFNYMSICIKQPLIYFIDEMNEINYKFVFCDNIIKLFNNGDSHFYLCCLFIKALALYSDDFYKNLPEWINDIVTSTNINENNNIFYLIHIIEI